MSPLRSVIYHRLPQEVVTASSSERPLPMIKNYVRDQKIAKTIIAYTS